MFYVKGNVESSIHLFRDCNFLRALSFVSSKGLQMDRFQNFSLKEWIGLCLDSPIDFTRNCMKPEECGLFFGLFVEHGLECEKQKTF